MKLLCYQELEVAPGMSPAPSLTIPKATAGNKAPNGNLPSGNFLLDELFFLLPIWEDECRGWRDSRESHAFIQNICTPPTPPRTTWAIPVSCGTHCSLSHCPCLPRSQRSSQWIGSFKGSCLPQIKAKVSNGSAGPCSLCPTISFPHPTCSPSHHKLSPSHTGPFPVPQPNQVHSLLEATLRGGSSYHCPREKIRILRFREIHFTYPEAENSRAQGWVLSGICP